MSQSLASLTREFVARAALDRYKKDSYALALECFTTTDRKAKIGQKLAKPWYHSEPLARIWHGLDTAHEEGLDEFWTLKPRQNFCSWQHVGFGGAKMLLEPGYAVYAQSKKDPESMELLYRLADIYRNLRGPLKDCLVEGRDWEVSGNVLTIMQVMGEPSNSKFEALPQGEEQWRSPAISFGILDEFSRNVAGQKAYFAAKAACQDGGILAVLSTGKYGTFYNQQVSDDLRACGVDPQELVIAA